MKPGFRGRVLCLVPGPTNRGHRESAWPSGLGRLDLIFCSVIRKRFCDHLHVLPCCSLFCFFSQVFDVAFLVPLSWPSFPLILGVVHSLCFLWVYIFHLFSFFYLVPCPLLHPFFFLPSSESPGGSSWLLFSLSDGNRWGRILPILPFSIWTKSHISWPYTML